MAEKNNVNQAQDEPKQNNGIIEKNGEKKVSPEIKSSPLKFLIISLESLSGDLAWQLKKEGHAIRFILVENMSNDKAKDIYKKADILIDQLLAGWYGGLAVELMALGKPVIAYIRKEDLKFIPTQMKDELPVINATPQTIYAILKKYITINKNDLVLIGKKSRQFVERWHDPIKIAQQLKKDYLKITN